MINLLTFLMPAATSAPGQGPSMLMQILFFGLIFVVFYVFLILPQQRQQKKHKEMLESIKKGDKIITIGGIIGEVVRVKDDTMKVKIDKDVEIEIQKSAVSTKIEKKKDKEE